jgi:hypothetical protein
VSRDWTVLPWNLLSSKLFDRHMMARKHNFPSGIRARDHLMLAASKLADRTGVQRMQFLAQFVGLWKNPLKKGMLGVLADLIGKMG